MKNTDIAYIAGLIDGEGYLGIKKTPRLYNGRVNPQYQERIQIRMVDEQAIEFITNTFGGTYHKESPHAAKGRPLYCFATTDKQSVKIITTILPYLRVKNRVAETVLRLRSLKDNPDKVAVLTTVKSRWGHDMEVKRWRYSPKHIAECERLWQLCKDINKGIA